MVTEAKSTSLRCKKVYLTQVYPWRGQTGADPEFQNRGGPKPAIEHSDRAEGEYDEYL